MVDSYRQEDAEMQSQQLKHTAPAVAGDPDGGEADRDHGRRRGAADRKLTRADWLLIVTMMAVALLMGYLAYNGWLPEGIG